MRASAVGFVYSWSRFSTIFTGFIIAWLLGQFGVPGVLVRRRRDGGSCGVSEDFRSTHQPAGAGGDIALMVRMGGGSAFVAQVDRATGFEPVGWGFESL